MKGNRETVPSPSAVLVNIGESISNHLLGQSLFAV